ncbi:unnamed protein product [Urochloa decumbens]|uniref:F-box domain-containing protein n=1 Tax=Urochloa decumbens TaxID=240449 RepID=A0ABC9BXT9_9POAL
MPPGKRALLQLQTTAPHSSTSTVARNSGWLSVRRDPSNFKRPRRADEGDGSPLPDKILLGIFAGIIEIADLVRCAATCRRWRRLVSCEAAFIVSSRRRPGRFMPPLALGFFHQRDGAAPRFIPTPSASCRFPDLQEPLPLLVPNGRLVDSSSRVVASRNGLVVVDLRHSGGGGKHNRALRICVCNPMTGLQHTLPPLTGKDGVGHYACTVLTADDRHGENGGTDSLRSASSYRLLLVHSRRGFTAFRSYSSDDNDGGGWSPEAKVTGAQLGKQQMGLMCNGVVAPGGRVAYWLAKDVVFALRLDTMEASVLAKKRVHIDSTRLGFTPEGNLCKVQLDRAMNKATHRWSVRVLGISTNGLHSGDYDRHERWQKEYDIWIESFSLDNGATLKLRWFCERSGVVVFTTDHWIGGGRISEVYAFSIPTRTLEKVASNNVDGNGGNAWENFYWYEMDQAAYLSSLAEPGRMMEDI